MRRFNVTSAGQGQLKVVASMAAGTREKVMVIEVSGEQHLIGVTSNQINHLAKLENPISEANETPAARFKDKFTQALAGKIQSGMQMSKDNQPDKVIKDE